MKFVLIVSLIASIGAQVGAHHYQEDYPICGSDGNTYINQQHFYHLWQADNTLAVKFYGTCEFSTWDDYICQNEGISWKCGSDGASYKNDCYFEFGLKRNSALLTRHGGECKSYIDNENVCGTDLKVYDGLEFLAEQSVRPRLNEWPLEYCDNPTPSTPRLPISEVKTVCGNDFLVYFESTFIAQQKIRPELEALPLNNCYYKPHFQV